MIIGIGNDLLKTDRLARSLERAGFVEYCFSERELACFAGTPNEAQKLAGCFAAKEAFSKALGTGVRGFSLNEVSVLRDSNGKPYYEFAGRAADIVKKLSAKAHVALTNDGGFVCAFAVLESEN